MKDYLRGLYGKAPGPIAPGLRERVLGKDIALEDDVRPGSLVTTTYEQCAAEIGDLAQSEEDVLMYALFPIEARAYLEKHQTGAEGIVFMTGHETMVVREEETVDVGQIRELMQTFEKSDVAEITVTEGDKTITMRKTQAIAQTLVTTIPTAPLAVASLTAATDAGAASAQQPSAVNPNYKTITSPMVGTYYESPSPDASAFVKEGDSVSVGDALCIVEAMKLMNEVSAQEDAIIREIVVKDGDMVEYGTVLMYYEAI
jgi:oxaloacetate decarboxylase alpha subunit